MLKTTHKLHPKLPDTKITAAVRSSKPCFSAEAQLFGLLVSLLGQSSERHCWSFLFRNIPHFPLVNSLGFTAKIYPQNMPTLHFQCCHPDPLYYPLSFRSFKGPPVWSPYNLFSTQETTESFKNTNLILSLLCIQHPMACYCIVFN